MITIIDLPEELLLIIIDYASERGDPCSAFPSVNRSLSSSLLRKVRRIITATSSEKWKSDEQRARLLGMIEVPSRQLFLRINANVSTFSSMLSEIRSFYWLRDFSNTSQAMLTLINSTRIEVKNLELHDVTGIIRFDVIPSLESLYLRGGNRLKIETLNLPAYPLLRLLKLSSCSSVKDVSCLDGIHSLELHHCHNITDISPLNNNYRVIIFNCDGITSYSRSFRFTRHVQVVEVLSDGIISLDNCFHLRSLSLSSRMGIDLWNLRNIWECLLVLLIRSAANLTVLPPNRLRKVSIIKCDNFTCLENMDHIQSIHLDHLNHIKTLTGLGPKNQTITLKSMNGLKDIRALNEAQSVTISDCPLLFNSNRLNCLTSVKELHLSQRLITPASNFLLSLNDLHSLINLNVLDLWFHFGLFPAENEKLRFHILQTFKTVEQIYLHGNFINIMNEDILNEFNVNVTNRGIPTVILLRKERVTSFS